MAHSIQSPIHSDSLADVLERVLDKGVVIAGDVVVSLVGIELLSIKVRLLITTVDKATEMGINWWQMDPTLCSSAQTAAQLEDQSAATASIDGVAFASPAAAAVAAEPAGPLSPPPGENPHVAALARAEAEREELEAANRELRGRLAILEKRMARLGA